MKNVSSDAQRVQEGTFVRKFFYYFVEYFSKLLKIRLLEYNFLIKFWWVNKLLLTLHPN